MHGRQLLTEVWIVLYGMARGLAYVHGSLHATHRDIKPANVLLRKWKSRSGAEWLVPVIADFGLAKRIESGESLRQSAISGSPIYMAPEVIKNLEAPPWTADVYSWAISCYEVLTGELAYKEYSNAASLQRAVLAKVRPKDFFSKMTAYLHLAEGEGAKFVNIVRLCWQDAHDKRLPFYRICGYMEASDYQWPEGLWDRGAFEEYAEWLGDTDP